MWRDVWRLRLHRYSKPSATRRRILHDPHCDSPPRPLATQSAARTLQMHAAAISLALAGAINQGPTCSRQDGCLRKVPRKNPFCFSYFRQCCSFFERCREHSRDILFGLSFVPVLTSPIAADTAAGSGRSARSGKCNAWEEPSVRPSYGNFVTWTTKYGHKTLH